MAGPWFAVRTGEEGWAPYGEVWMSDGGGTDGMATLEMKVELLPPEDGIVSAH